MNGGLGCVGIAVAPRDVGAQKGLGVVLDLLAHGGVGLGAEFNHRMRRSGIGAGSHGGDVGRFQQEKSRRTGARARRSHINNDRNPRSRESRRPWRASSPAGRPACPVRSAARAAPSELARAMARVQLACADRLDRVGEDQLVHKRLLGAGRSAAIHQARTPPPQIRPPQYGEPACAAERMACSFKA